MQLRTPLAIAFIAVHINICCAPVTARTFSEAVIKGLIKITVTGAMPDTTVSTSSSHYGPCIQMTVASLSAEKLNLQLDYGYKLEPADTNTQTMLVTQSQPINISPKQKTTYRIYAMCTEAHDGGPSPAAVFYLGKRTSGNLLRLAELINKKQYQNDAAQNAVWCLTDNYDLQAIYSDDTAMMYELRRFVAQAKGIAGDKIYTVVYSAPKQQLTTRTIYSGSISYSISRTSKILIALFDEDNHMKKVYVNNELQHAGEYTYNYQLDGSEMNHRKHYLRMFKDGKPEEEIAVIPREE